MGRSVGASTVRRLRGELLLGLVLAAAPSPLRAGSELERSEDDNSYLSGLCPLPDVILGGSIFSGYCVLFSGASAR